MFATAPGVDVDRVIDAVRFLAGVDLSTCDQARLVGVEARLREVEGLVAAGLGLVAGRSAELFAAGRGIAPEEFLSRGGRRSMREGRRVAQRSEALQQAPSLAAAVGSGDVSVEHADALAAVVSRLDEHEREALQSCDRDMTTKARLSTPSQFRTWLGLMVDKMRDDDGCSTATDRLRRSRATWRIDEVSGMYIIHAELAPELGRRVVDALEAGVDQLWSAQSGAPGAALAPELAELGVLPELKSDRQHLAGFVFTELMSQRPAGGRFSGPPDAELLVLVDLHTLQHGLHDESVCEWRDGEAVPVGTARRLACSARILPVVLDGEGSVLDLGRAQRLANRAQRRALRAMYRTCAIEGCDVRFDRCQIHHVHWWELLGPTDLANLIPLCHTHHHLVHEGGWRLEIEQPSRVVTLIRPDGVVESRSGPGLSGSAGCGRRSRGSGSEERGDARSGAPPPAGGNDPPDGRRKNPVVGSAGSAVVGLAVVGSAERAQSAEVGEMAEMAEMAEVAEVSEMAQVLDLFDVP